MYFALLLALFAFVSPVLPVGPVGPAIWSRVAAVDAQPADWIMCYPPSGGSDEMDCEIVKEP